MSEWKKTRLGEIADCTLGKMLDANKNKGKPRQYLANVDVRWGRFDLTRLQTMKMEDGELAKYSLRPDDLVMCEGGEPGRCAIWQDGSKEMYIQKALMRIRAHKELNIWYLYFWFCWYAKRGGLTQYQTGTGIKHMPLQKLVSVELPLPPRHIQDRIAGILSDYDSAIANCRKQIALLEEAATRLYRESFKDGKGEKKRIGDILRHYANGGWGKENSIGKFTECGYVIRGTDIDDLSYGNRNSIPLRVHSKHDIETKRLINGDIIIELSNGNINNIGRSLLVSDDMLSWFDDVVICASFCKFMRPIDNQMSIALAWHIKYLQSSGKMKVFKNAGANGINNFAFDEFLGSEIQLGDFDSKSFTALGNMTLQIQTMRSQIRTLTEARDRLLPKLMKGEIAV